MLTSALLLLSLSSQPAAQNAAFRVYVYPTPGHTTYSDQLLKAREQAVALVKAELRRKKGLVLVDSPELADVRVELVESTTKHMGREHTTPSGLIGSQTKPLKDYAIRGTLSVDDYALDIEGTHRVQKQAAGAVADAVAVWVKQNSQKLLQRRR